MGRAVQDHPVRRPVCATTLYRPAVSAQPWNPALRALRDQTEGRTASTALASVCAAMRKIAHIAFAILQSGKPLDPNYGLA
jgi:hypothetical protein